MAARSVTRQGLAALVLRCAAADPGNSVLTVELTEEQAPRLLHPQVIEFRARAAFPDTPADGHDHLRSKVANRPVNT